MKKTINIGFSKKSCSNLANTLRLKHEIVLTK